MTELSKSYDPAAVEQKWYRFWLEQNYFHADAATPKAPFSIAIPPPNVTGSLHMGHALFVTIQDILIRWKRMGAYNAMWMPGTDHAGIATQMVVERMLHAHEGKSRHDLGREEFTKRIWVWKEKHGGRITEQLKVLGASLDWERERFTMDEGLSRAVREAFVRLYDEGLIYRAERLINWCSVCYTALSDLEVEHEETQGSIWHIAYPVVGGKEGERLIVATTRPETMLGDTAVAVHPEDERFMHLIGKRVALPLTGREIPIIGDAVLVDREFGSGAVKITPAHDFNDFEVGQRHKLPSLSVIGRDGQMNEAVPEKYRGLTTAEARKAVLADLAAAGLLIEEKPHTLSVGRCQRSDTIVEPLLSMQWWCKATVLAGPAIEAVEKGQTKFVPESWTKTYMHWMTNIKDWCISRQLWWGHRIPVWYCEHDHLTVAREAPTACACGSGKLYQDDDVLDTWFSSALWPFSTLGWPDATRELKTFYPTTVMETGYDILFFWVARMMMFGLHFMKQVPFRTVFLHAIVVDEHGDKMSKVKGNVIDPLDVVYGATLPQLLQKAKDGLAPESALDNIKKSFPTGIPAAGADALRFTLAALAAQGRNIRLSIQRVEGNRHFANKMWNATRFALMNLTGFDADAFGEALRVDGTGGMSLGNRWILSRLQRCAAEVDAALEQYRFNDAAQSLYRFVWSELCDWYIELAKPALYDQAEEQAAQKRRRSAQGCLAMALETAMRLLHPFMPFVTEEIWQQLPKPSGTPQSIMITMFPSADTTLIDDSAERAMESLQGLVSAIRNLRAEYNVPPSLQVEVTLQAKPEALALLETEESLVKLLGRVSTLHRAAPGDAPAGTVVALAGEVQVAVHLAGQIDVAAESTRINKDLQKADKERTQINGRLANASFVERAPAAVVEKERARVAELDERILTLGRSLERLKSLS